MTQKMLPIFARRPIRGEKAEITEMEPFHLCIGSVLGDSTISKRDFNMEMEQKSPTFACWKKNLCIQYGLRVEKMTDKFHTFQFGGVSLPFTVKRHKKKRYRGFSFLTRALFSEQWRSLFYKKLRNPKGFVEYRKRIPPNIKEYFWGDLALAIWFLDDGWYDHAKKTIRVSTGEYPIRECKILSKCLKQNFNLQTQIYPLTGKPHHFYLSPSSYEEFYKRVSPILKQLAAVYPKYPKSPGMKNKVLPLVKKQLVKL